MEMNIKTKSKLFRMAHSIKTQFDNFGQALKHAWKIIKLIAKMKKGNVSFSFRKVSGEIRKAVGTLMFKYESKGTGKTTPIDSLMYFDAVANGFRSFKIANLV